MAAVQPWWPVVGAGQSVTYTLPASTYGYNLTNLTILLAAGRSGRDQQAYTVYYSTIATPNTFIALGTVNYNPANPLAVQSATRATLTPASGYLATNVAAVMFDFTTPSPKNGYEGYSEIATFGELNIPPAVPVTIGTAIDPANNLIMNLGSLIVGRNYQVQSTTNLVPPIIWNLETSFTATATTATLTNSTASDPQKFYQISGY